MRGKITVRRRGGGAKRLYRAIDFKRDKHGVPCRVESIEYDPNRSSRIALVVYADGERRYHLAPTGAKVGDRWTSGPGAEIRQGNALPLRSIPTGTVVHNIEMRPGRGGQMCRGAGTGAQLLAREEQYAMLRMPSGEVRRVPADCMATIGTVGNAEHKNQDLGKAGRSRHLGRRPSVRGSAMTPRDHPHGGGEGTLAHRDEAPEDAVGPPGAGAEDAAAQAHGRVHRAGQEAQVVSRSIKKGPYVHPKLAKRVERAQQAGTKVVIRTWSRASMIMPDMVGLTIAVHDGRRHIPVFVTENMVGHKLGEFAPTRTFRGHTSKSERSSSVR